MKTEEYKNINWDLSETNDPEDVKRNPEHDLIAPEIDMDKFMESFWRNCGKAVRLLEKM